MMTGAFPFITFSLRFYHQFLSRDPLAGFYTDRIKAFRQSFNSLHRKCITSCKDLLVLMDHRFP